MKGRIVVIGASLSGIDAPCELVSRLPKGFPAGCNMRGKIHRNCSSVLEANQFSEGQAQKVAVLRKLLAEEEAKYAEWRTKNPAPKKPE